MVIRINLLDSSAAINIAKDLGMVETAQAFMAGDYESGIMSFVENIAGVIKNRGVSPVLKTIFTYAAAKTVLKAIPGTSKVFNVLGIIEFVFV